jgi:cytochrome c551/c552
VGLGDFAECGFTNTHSTQSYLLAGGAKPRVIDPEERGEIAYMGICAGCHAYDDVLIGPSIRDIQAMYAGNVAGIVSYINAPFKVRAEYPEMPAQNYLDGETQLAVADYLLNIPLEQSQP